MFVVGNYVWRMYTLLKHKNVLSEVATYVDLLFISWSFMPLPFWHQSFIMWVGLLDLVLMHHGDNIFERRGKSL
jgi:hypothetical protein